MAAGRLRIGFEVERPLAIKARIQPNPPELEDDAKEEEEPTPPRIVESPKRCLNTRNGFAELCRLASQKRAEPAREDKAGKIKGPRDGFGRWWGGGQLNLSGAEARIWSLLITVLSLFLPVRSDTVMPSSRLSSFLRFNLKSRHQSDHITSTHTLFTLLRIAVAIPSGRKARHLIHCRFFKHAREPSKLFPPAQDGSKDLVPQAEVE